MRFNGFVCKNKETEEVFSLAKKVANSSVPVLICGETGTGKEVLSDYIHYNGIRSDKPFVKLNCAAIPANLLESELFGCVKGGFSGAISRDGLVTEADEGTLFLDELGEMPLECQSKVLRFLQSGEYRKVGEAKTRKSSARIITATNANLREAVLSKSIRKDLLYRLQVIKLQLPNLRSRIDEIPALTEHFLNKYSIIEGRRVSIEPEAVEFLKTCHWPGNIRQLENEVRRAIILNETGKITEKDFSGKEHIDKDWIGEEKEKELITLEDHEREIIRKALAKYKGNKKLTAAVLKIGRQTLYHKIEKYGL